MELLRKHMLREGHIDKPELIELIAAAVLLMSKCLFLFALLVKYVKYLPGVESGNERKENGAGVIESC